MNQIFSPSRFIKYASYQNRMRSKALLLIVAGVFVALIFFMLFMFSTNRHWNANLWQPMFFITGAIAALLYMGYSFPYFRKKDTTISNIMLPASVFEKFVYEYLIRVVLFTIFYPVFFYVTAYLTVEIAHFILPDKMIILFKFNYLFINSNRESDYLLFYYVVPALYFLASSLLIAGAVIVRRFPLVKTLVAVGILALSVVGYFYLILEKMHLDNGIGYIIKNSWIKSEESAIKTLFVFIIFTIITTLTYTYFKIKDKEV